MPVRESQRARYPADWPEISRRIRFVRANRRCECTGQCGHDHAAEAAENPLSHIEAWADPDSDLSRCVARHSQPAPITGSIVVLTTAHLDHQPENCADENLLAMCNRCHLAYDAEHHAETRAAALREALAAVMDPLFDLPEGNTP